MKVKFTSFTGEKLRCKGKYREKRCRESKTCFILVYFFSLLRDLSIFHAISPFSHSFPLLYCTRSLVRLLSLLSISFPPLLFQRYLFFRSFSLLSLAFCPTCSIDHVGLVAFTEIQLFVEYSPFAL